MVELIYHVFFESDEGFGLYIGSYQEKDRAEKMAKDTRPDDEKITELFQLTQAKKPTADQLRLAKEHLAKHEKNKKVAYENILWALLNSKAFLFNQ